MDEIKTCIDRPPVSSTAARMHALTERPSNAPMIDPALLPPGVDRTQMLALPTGKLWKPGRVLRVRFLDGDPAIQQKLQPYAHVWSQHCSITFVFGDDPEAEIRISFKDRGSWSYVGTDCLGVPKNQATMNFGWLKRDTSDEEYSRVVTHEFGHALGCIHEHQNPATDIPWDKPKVYAYYAGPPNNWTKQQTDVNLFWKYGAEQTQFSEFDPNSIMLYPIPNEFTIGDFEVGWNTGLSETDKSFIGSVYPVQTQTEQVLTVGGPAIKGAIGEFGEVDEYVFTIERTGNYRVETTGRQDLIMGLYGPNNPALLLAADDDTGVGLNPRIDRSLRPGKYVARVRHYSPTKTGDYAIALTKRR